jgi:hypothetical protein
MLNMGTLEVLGRVERGHLEQQQQVGRARVVDKRRLRPRHTRREKCRARRLDNREQAVGLPHVVSTRARDDIAAVLHLPEDAEVP